MAKLHHFLPPWVEGHGLRRVFHSRKVNQRLLHEHFDGSNHSPGPLESSQ